MNGAEATTTHQVHTADSARLSFLRAGSVDLTVTSPPYPMIKQWDAEFAADPKVAAALAAEDGPAAFEAMHRQLDAVWRQVARVTRPGGFACINVGDATRSIGGSFRLFANHVRVTTAFLRLGFVCLPPIVWRKETNAPNKFMGSGMLPAGAYVTLEHELILVLRKGAPRTFDGAAERRRRRQSAVFWEERNQWFSDLWTFKGVRQGKGADRTGAFPFELAFRLVHMYSARGDVVLDPFLGTGTVCLAAAAGRRNSVGVERAPKRAANARQVLLGGAREASRRTKARLESHRRFADSGARELRYHNDALGMPVMTRQETDLRLDQVVGIEEGEGEALVALHAPLP